MNIVLSARLALQSWVTLLVLAGASFAQTAPSEPPPENVRQFLELLSNPEVKAWLEGKIPAAARGAARRAACRPDLELGGRCSCSPIGARCGHPPHPAGVVERDRRGLARCELRQARSGGQFAGDTCRRRFRRRMARPPRVVAIPTGGRGEQTPAGRPFWKSAALSTFALASAGSFLAFAWPPLLGRVVLTFLLAFIAVRVVRTVVTLLFSFGGGAAPSDQPAAPVVESDASATLLASAGERHRRLPAVRLGRRQSHAEPGLLHRRGTADGPSVRAGHAGDRYRDRLAAAGTDGLCRSASRCSRST